MFIDISWLALLTKMSITNVLTKMFIDKDVYCDIFVKTLFIDKALSHEWFLHKLVGFIDTITDVLSSYCKIFKGSKCRHVWWRVCWFISFMLAWLQWMNIGVLTPFASAMLTLDKRFLMYFVCVRSLEPLDRYCTSIPRKYFGRVILF